jgi:hypothetical protein
MYGLTLLVVVTLLAGAEENPPQACSIHGTVRDAKGSPVESAVITIVDQKQFSQTIVTAKNGDFLSGPLPCDHSFTVEVQSQEAGRKEFKDLTPGMERLDVLLSKGLKWDPRMKGIVGTLIFVALYLLTIIVMRWHNIAFVDKQLLRSEILLTQISLTLEAAPDSPGEKKLEDALGELKTDLQERPADRWKNILFWNRGSEIALWARLREIQKQAINLWPKDSIERVRARLQLVGQQLKRSSDPTALALAEQIETVLREESVEKQARCQELLGEGVAFISADREKSYTDLMIWQNKASWLIFLGCALIIMCTLAREWPILFLAGAAGGFLSRLARAVKGTATPTDYGASWTTFFLSPVLGALMGGLALFSWSRLTISKFSTRALPAISSLPLQLHMFRTQA